MKITLTSRAPFIAGAEVAVERLALGLMAAGHDVLLVVGTRGEAEERFRAAGIRCEFVPQQFTDKLKWFQYRSARNQLVEVLRREQPDLVHSNDLPTHQMTSDAAQRLGIPRVCHHRFLFDGPAIDWFNKFGAERHVFVSRALMDSLADASAQLAASPRAVVYDGLPIPDLPPPNAQLELRRKLNLPADRLIVLFAGQVIERKGVDELLRGWSQLNEWHSRATLIILGDDLAEKGAYRRKMEALAAELEGPVQFVGFQKNVPEWLIASDVAMVPSRIEPLGNATLEAMSYGLPVIGGNVGGIPEMIVNDVTGLLIPPNSPADLAAALARLLGDAELRVHMGRAARQRCIELFSLDAHIQSVLHEYDVLLDQWTAQRSNRNPRGSRSPFATAVRSFGRKLWPG